ncbi:hypothetical protein M0802_003280 [Mischocyttarus mexicanus]|nr:hypothetical protein M0802_003280 [Mischocyttarus mexicanus]
MLCRLINQYTRISYKINHFRIGTRFLYQLPQIPDINGKQTPKLNSMIKDKNLTEDKYPGYEIIYKYPNMKYISLLHVFKRNLLMSTVVLIPIVFGLYQGSILSESTVIISTLICKPLTVIENLIKIAYVNRWGKRIDISTKIDDIKPLDNNDFYSKKRFFRRIHITSLQFPLKLYVNNSIISNKEQLTNVLGDYE